MTWLLAVLLVLVLVRHARILALLAEWRTSSRQWQADHEALYSQFQALQAERDHALTMLSALAATHQNHEALAWRLVTQRDAAMRALGHALEGDYQSVNAILQEHSTLGGASDDDE